MEVHESGVIPAKTERIMKEADIWTGFGPFDFPCHSPLPLLVFVDYMYRGCEAR